MKYSAKEALKKILRLKDRLDGDILSMDFVDHWLLFRMYNRGELLPGWNDRQAGERVVINGEAFVQALLPFADPIFDGKNAQVSSVNSYQVLAGAYSYVPDLSSAKQNELADWFDSQSIIDHHEGAHYVQIGEFDLYIASEGKHRVDLYRKLNRPIIARVSKSEYPSFDELRLVRLIPFGGVALRYVGNQEMIGERIQSWQRISENLAALPFSESIHMLASYGVQWGENEWSLNSRMIERKVKLYICRRRYIR